MSDLAGLGREGSPGNFKKAYADMHSMQWITYSDLWTLAGVVAVKHMGGELPQSLRSSRSYS